MRKTKHLNNFSKFFGDDFCNHAFLALTKLDNQEHDNFSPEQFLKQSGDDLKNGLQKCNGRYIAINNQLTDETLERHSLQILEELTLCVNNHSKAFFQSSAHKNYIESVQDELVAADDEKQAELTRVLEEYERKLNDIQISNNLSEETCTTQ